MGRTRGPGPRHPGLQSALPSRRPYRGAHCGRPADRASPRAVGPPCYRSCLDAAVEAAGQEFSSLAFCCISTGEFRFPKAEAARIALATVTAWLGSHPDAQVRVIFDVYTEEDHALYQSLF